MKRLHFYNIKDEYIKYLYEFDNKVPFNKQCKRPYIGIVLDINETTYFAPMFSPKKQHMLFFGRKHWCKICSFIYIQYYSNIWPFTLFIKWNFIIKFI